MEENLIIDIIPKFMYRNKCKSFIILNDKKEILKYNSSHNHPKKEYDVSLSIMKHKIKNGIEKSSIPFGIKIKPLYNKVSKEMRFICPEYNSIKSQISRNLNKKLPSNLTTFTEIPNKFKYYKTNLFPTKPSYYELIDKLNELEHLPYYDYQRKIRGIWKIKKRAVNKTNEISVLIERYNNIEAKLINAKWDRNNTTNLWFDCLTDLNNIL
ncbi:hypothetical protein LY90DRAFT_506059 [Neocallimastix californiae]|uniref:FLYWCH-type domain-containing protein n=1 Tax=Neocallimastix californiae TaxID=1754190 RepID=A0A1Y2DJI6_9FUNG|nr:hypothetical protein LY90DRAFT_506059 [Neocallimastix californiae]|eukprot:ORY59391.1 hypothetical protein LY90DRAFT_506059 [Neocallimastix californiae]